SAPLGRTSRRPEGRRRQRRKVRVSLRLSLRCSRLWRINSSLPTRRAGDSETSERRGRPSARIAARSLVLLVVLLLVIDEALNLVLAGVVLEPLLRVLGQFLIVDLLAAHDLLHRRVAGRLLPV